MTDDPEIAAHPARILASAIQHLIDQGVPPEEARTRAEAAQNALPAVPIPTLGELDTMMFAPKTLVSMDID
jgi:hypothetical protein